MLIIHMLVMTVFLNQCMVGELPKVSHFPVFRHKQEGGPSCRKSSQHHMCLPRVTRGIHSPARMFSKWDGAVR